MGEGLARTEPPSVEDAVRAVLAALPSGWQYPGVCVARAELANRTFEPESFEPTPWLQVAPIEAHDQPVGRLEIYYTEARPSADEGPRTSVTTGSSRPIPSSTLPPCRKRSVPKTPSC